MGTSRDREINGDIKDEEKVVEDGQIQVNVVDDVIENGGGNAYEGQDKDSQVGADILNKDVSFLSGDNK